MSEIIYFGELHKDSHGNQYFERDGEFVPLILWKVKGKMAYKMSDGKYVDASGLKIVNDHEHNSQFVAGSEALFFIIYNDFQKTQKARAAYGDRTVLYGDLHRDRFGNYSFEYGGEYIELTFISQGGKRFARLLNGKLIDASGIKIQDNQRGGREVIGSEKVFSKLYTDFQKAKEERQRSGGMREVVYGAYSIEGNSPHLKIGDTWIRLNISTGRNGERMLELFDGTRIPMEKMRLVKDSTARWHLVGPEMHLQKILADFGTAVNAQKEAAAKEAMSRKAIGNVDEAPYRTIDTAKKVRNFFRRTVIAAAFVATAFLIPFGLRLNTTMPPSPENKQGGKAPTEQVYKQTHQTDHSQILAGKKEAKAAEKPEVKMQKADTLDMSLKENLDVARKKGFWGLAQKANPNLSNAKIAKLTSEAAKANLKEGHKDINNWHTGNLKNPRMVIIEREAGQKSSHETIPGGKKQEIPRKSPANPLDKSMKENLDIARKQGFRGLATMMTPHMSVIKKGAMAKKITKDNLEPGHKSINAQNTSQFKTPRMIRVKRL
ncbi:MAG: hypothetical protein WC602_00655 [archaeon]